MLTVKKLKEILATAPDDAQVVIHLGSGRGYEGYMGKYFTNSENTPYDGNCVIDTLANSEYGVVVISDWKL